MPKAPRIFLIPLFILAVSLSSSLVWSQDTNAAPASPPSTSSVGDYMNKGIAAGSHGDLDDAVTAFTEVIKLDPNLAAAYTKRGMALSLQHKYADALTDLDKAIQLDPKSQEAYYQRGSVRGQKGDFDGALTDFNQAIVLAPGYAMAFYNRGHVKYFKGDLKGALDDLNQAITLDQAATPVIKHAPSYWLRGVVHLALEDHPSALADFKESLKDGFAYGAYWMWIVQSEDGDSGIARNNLQVAAANTDLFTPGDWSSDLVNFLLGKLPQDQLVAHAKAGGDEAQSRLCEAWFYIGMANRFSGDTKSARDNFQQAIDTGAIQSEELIEARRQLARLQ